MDRLPDGGSHFGDGHHGEWSQSLAGDRSHPGPAVRVGKPFVVLQAANLFAHWKRSALDQKLLWLASFAILVLLILKQPNLSTAALIGLLIWLMAFSAGLPLLQLFGTALAGGMLGISSILINEYQRYDSYDPSGDINVQLIVQIPEIPKNYTIRYEQICQTMFNNYPQSLNTFVEPIFDTEAAEYIPNFMPTRRTV